MLMSITFFKDGFVCILFKFKRVFGLFCYVDYSSSPLIPLSTCLYAYSGAKLPPNPAKGVQFGTLRVDSWFWWKNQLLNAVHLCHGSQSAIGFKSIIRMAE